MGWRFRCDLTFQPGSGLPAWAAAQLDVRLQQAHHIRSGQPDEEPARIDTTDTRLSVDLTFPDDREDLAQDTRDTLMAASILAWLAPADPVVGGSWGDYHFCRHDGDGGPCKTVPWTWRQD